jgi:hypothetical protein
VVGRHGEAVVNNDTTTTASTDSGSNLFSDYQVGTLGQTDLKYESGEYYDIFNYDFSLGQNLIIDVISSDFNTYVTAVSPSGEQYYNDDYYADDPENTNAGLDIYVEEPGAWQIHVSSSLVAEVGNYELYLSDIGVSDGTDTGSTEVESSEVESSTAGTEAPDIVITDMNSTKARSTNMGRLEPGDDILDDGSYVDYYSINLEVGQSVSFSLVSADFETYLGVMKPSGEVLELDEQSDSSRSKISLTVEEAGIWYIFVTSSSAGQEGNYLLSIKR